MQKKICVKLDAKQQMPEFQSNNQVKDLISKAFGLIATINGRIWVAFLTIALITTSLGAYAGLLINRAGALTERTYNQSLMSISYARAASADFSGMQAALARRILINDSTSRKQLDDIIETLNQSLSDDLSIAASRSESPRVQAAVAETVRLVQTWRNEAGRFPLDASQEHAWNMLDHYAASVSEKINRIINYTAGDGFIYRENAKHLVENEWRLNAVGTGLALFLSGLIAQYLARRIIGSVGAALAFAERIASGDLNSELPTRSPDELGALIASMGVMRNTLRVMMNREMAERRSAQRRLADALESSKAGILMIDVNGDVAIANSQALDFFNDSPRQPLPGIIFSELSGALVEAIAASTNKNVETRISDGRWVRVSRSITQEGGYVAICNDISELKDQQALLKETNTNFYVALSNISQGLCMYDSNNRLRVVNKRFCEIFRVDDTQIRLGMSLDKIIEMSIAAGSEAKAIDSPSIHSRAINGLNSPARQVELRDERTISVTQQLLQDGGWVATYEDVTEHKRSQDRVVFLARHDALTGLPNRVTLAEAVERSIARLGRGEGFALLCLDLDRFKEVNDTFGHPVGDQLLCQVAERLAACVRQVDTVCRAGGDEFSIIQCGVSQRKDAVALARRIVKSLSLPFDLNGRRISIGVSVGIAIAPAHGSDFEKLLNCADSALYLAKGDRGGKWCFFNSKIEENLQNSRTMETEIRAALPSGQFEVHYQPIYDLRRRKVSAFEALLRWRHPVRGLVGPANFIPLCEEIGLIVPIGEWVLNAACAEARTWPDDVKVAVNVSAIQFSNPLFIDTVKSALICSSISADRLELEITESVLMNNSESTLETLYAIRSLGVRICMDDFGTGYSSLNYLRKFPFDKIKIDRSFIRDLIAPKSSEVIVRTIIGLGFNLGICVTAEGVETDEQLEWLGRAGCDEAQGYLISRPVASVRDITREGFLAGLNESLQRKPTSESPNRMIASAPGTQVIPFRGKRKKAPAE